MSLLATLQTTPQATQAHYRRYADLLRADDSNAMDELHQLMLILGKTVDQAAGDKAAIDESTKPLKAVAAGKNTDSRVASLWEQIQLHEARTKEIVAERNEAISGAFEERSGLIDAKASAEEAIAALKKLQHTNPELLEELVIPDPKSLG